MKRVIIVFLAVVSLAIVSEGTKKVAGCAFVCPTQYEPLCASGPGVDITFGSECILKRFNCEHKDKQYVKKSDAECPDNAPVRLQ